MANVTGLSTTYFYSTIHSYVPNKLTYNDSMLQKYKSQIPCVLICIEGQNKIEI